MSQATKEGKYSGSGKWQNVVDVMLDAYERGKMRTGEKNRWNQFGSVTLFETSNGKKAEANTEAPIPDRETHPVEENEGSGNEITVYI